FTPPGTGASAALSSGSVTIASGKVQVTATANGAIGNYNVVASATGAAAANFDLTNFSTALLVVNIATDVVANTDNKTSLREALSIANKHVGEDTITFDPAVFGKTPQTITVTAPLTVLDLLHINAPGANVLTVSGGSTTGVFDIEAGAYISGLTVTGG